ncbi:hypothetical protein BST61_g1243 [Cercospora zeina]
MAPTATTSSRQPPAPVGCPILNSIPPEMQDRIVSFIPRPSDLKALCLSCEQLRSVAISYLYRLVVLDPLATSRNAGFFMHGNPGHAHVGRILFRNLEDETLSEQHVAANKVIRLALYCLAKNSIIAIGVPTRLRIEFETLAVLFTQQTSIHELYLGQIRGAAVHPPFKIHPRLEHLSVLRMASLGDERDLAFYKRIMVCSHGSIQRLSFCGATICHSADGGALRLHNTAHQDGLLYTEVFHHRHGTVDAKPLKLSKLRSLYMSQYNLKYGAEKWSTVIPFEQLRVMVIHCCIVVEKFFSWLGAHFGTHGSQLRKFRCSGHEFSSRALEDFLKSFSGLEAFDITDLTQRDSKRIDFTSLAGHYATLTQLKLGFASGSGIASSRRVLDAFDIVDLVTHCQNIEELFLYLPDTDIETIQGQEWGVYGRWIDFIARLPKLEILNIASWPAAPFPDNITPPHTYEAAYGHLISQCALAIQRRLDQHRPVHSSQLKLLSFGSASSTDSAMMKDGNSIPMKRMFFVRRPAWVMTDENASSMTEVSAREVKHYVPTFGAVGIVTGLDYGTLWSGLSLLADRT